MLPESVAGEFQFEIAHQTVTGDLCNDGRRCNSKAERIAVNKSRERDAVRCKSVPIDKEMIRPDRQLLNSPMHCEERGIQDIDFIYDRVVDNSYPHGLRAFRNPVEQELTLHSAQFLRIIHFGEEELGGKHDSRGYNRPGKGSAAGFVNAGNSGKPLLPELSLMKQHIGATIRIH